MISADDQLLEPGSHVAVVEIDCTIFDGEMLRFHNHLQSGPIIWQGETYQPWPYEQKGMGMRGQGKAPTPSLAAANIDGTIGALCMLYDDLIGAKVTFHETYAKYLDASNFPQGNPDADPSQERVQIWYIERKSSQNNKSVTWELSSPVDFQGQQIPSRMITQLCDWCMKGEYRGPDCGYTGAAMFDEDGNPTDDPAKDKCSGLISTGCRPRFGANNPLRHGGFPASGLIK